jgi:hypothetical protein
MTVSVTTWRSWKWARACARWSLVRRDLVTDETPCFVVGLRAQARGLVGWRQARCCGSAQTARLPSLTAAAVAADRGGKSLVDGLAAFVQPEIARSGGSRFVPIGRCRDLYVEAKQIADHVARRRWCPAPTPAVAVDEGGERRISLSHRSALALRLAVGLLKLLRLLSRLLGCGFWWRVDRFHITPREPVLGHIVGNIGDIAWHVRVAVVNHPIMRDHRYLHQQSPFTVWSAGR